MEERLILGLGVGWNEDAWCPYGIGLDAFRPGGSALRSQQKSRALVIAAHLMLRIHTAGDTGQASETHIAGSPDAIVERLGQYQDPGLSYLICGFVADSLGDSLCQVQIFAEEIAPQLREE